MWNVGGYAGFLVPDVASGVLTGSANTGAIQPGSGIQNNIGVYANSFSVIVTAVSGTSPTLDIGIEESVDGGTNWVRIYDFQRITANGAYNSPMIRGTWGTRYRYVQTVGGTTPSFTRAINRIMHTQPGEIHKQFFDRTINPNTLNSVTPTYFVDGCNFLQVVHSMGAITTTPPVMQLIGSEDGVNWYAIGATFNTAANSTFAVVVKDMLPKFVRVQVTTAGAGATLNYVSLKAGLL
jgi:hypothetical protein